MDNILSEVKKPMRPRKGSGAERLGIKFTGNPDAREYCDRPVDDCETGIPRSILENPGKYMIGSLSGD
jgi:hypothetical protein